MKIVNVIPIDWYGLIVVFENGELRSFEPSKYNLYDMYKFLAYPDILRSFTIDEDRIEWEGKAAFSSHFIIQNSTEPETDELKSKSLSIGSKNQAPTSEDLKHHVYDVTVRPFNSEVPIILSESIGGGIGDRGGARAIKIDDIKEYKNHFVLSDCIWAYQVINASKDNFRKLMDTLISEFLDKNYRKEAKQVKNS
mgnify:CR=1 FL=1